MMTALPPLAPRAYLRWDLVKRRLAELQPATVLELGCGRGATGARLARSARYLGVEPDSTSYQAARGRLAAFGGEVRQGVISTLPEGSSYDLVCAFEVLEHIEDDKAALTEWVRFVRPGGHLLLSVPAWQHRFGPWDELVGHYRRYSPEELTGRLLDAGLVEPDVTLYGWPLAYLLEAVRNRVAARRQTEISETSFEDRTARSGRMFQPKALAGVAIQAATTPFRFIQRLQPGSGTGIVALARRPA
jgi:SAM-dependent methyltransferase